MKGRFYGLLGTTLVVCGLVIGFDSWFNKEAEPVAPPRIEQPQPKKQASSENEWTDHRGRTIHADFRGVDDEDNLLLYVHAHGRAFPIAPSTLAKDDSARAKDLISEWHALEDRMWEVVGRFLESPEFSREIRPSTPRTTTASGSIPYTSSSASNSSSATSGKGNRSWTSITGPTDDPTISAGVRKGGSNWSGSYRQIEVSSGVRRTVEHAFQTLDFDNLEERIEHIRRVLKSELETITVRFSHQYRQQEQNRIDRDWIEGPVNRTLSQIEEIHRHQKDLPNSF